jgi:hypothetical protein
MRDKNIEKGRSIYIQAAIAVMLIQLIHKIVREIPGSFGFMGEGMRMGTIVTPIFAFILALGIVLLLLKIKWGLISGIADGICMLFQPIVVHVIFAKPDINNIWWYPIFPILQGLLIIYFCILAWKEID